MARWPPGRGDHPRQLPAVRALVLLDLASAHVQSHELDETLRVATAAVDLAEQTQSERVLSRARQFRRTIPAKTPHGALRDFDECLRAANARLNEVIVPATQYRAGLPVDTHVEYDDLLSHASRVHRLNFVESTSEAHMAASELMISMISELLAVWDQQPARAYGGNRGRRRARPRTGADSADHLASRRIPRLGCLSLVFTAIFRLTGH